MHAAPPKRLFIIAGEASGDNLAGALIPALRASGYDDTKLLISGIGGASCNREGMASLFPIDDLAVMGFTEILPSLPRILRRLRETKQAIRDTAPDMLLTIDSPGFAFRIAKAFPKGAAMRKWHFVAPSVWAYKPGRAKKTAALYDNLLALLPFEPPYFTKEGLDCAFVGHPYVSGAGKAAAASVDRKTYLRAAGDALIAVMPGSRRGEIRRIGPAICEGLRILAAEMPLSYVFLVNEERKHDTEILLNAFPDVNARARIVTDKEEIAGLRNEADFCILKSGTAVLEQTLYKAPACVVYKASALTAALMRRMLLVNYVSLPNLLVEREIIPELIQEDCTGEAIAATARRYLTGPEAERKRRAQREAMAAVPAMLGADDLHSPAEKAAALVIKTLFPS